MSEGKKYVVRFSNRYSTGRPNKRGTIKLTSKRSEAFVFTDKEAQTIDGGTALEWAQAHVKVWSDVLKNGVVAIG